MLGASARLSCLCTPVETSTAPRRTRNGLPRQCAHWLAMTDFWVCCVTLFLIKPEPRCVGSGLIMRTKETKAQGIQTFFGSGYSTPKQSTVTFFMTCGVWGRSL